MKNIPTAVLGFLLLLLLSTSPPVYAAPAPVAASPPELMPAATKEPIGSCPAWMTAGPHVIYRCVDEDNGGTVLYQNDVGFLVKGQE